MKLDTRRMTDRCGLVAICASFINIILSQFGFILFDEYVQIEFTGARKW